MESIYMPVTTGTSIPNKNQIIFSGGISNLSVDVLQKILHE